MLHVPANRKPRPAIELGDRVLAILPVWRSELPHDLGAMIESLLLVVTRERIENPYILKPIRHNSAKGLYELLAADSRCRLFLFRDSGSTPRRILVVGAYTKRGVSKEEERKSQNAAILEAARLMDCWNRAQPIPEAPKFRVLKKEK